MPNHVTVAWRSTEMWPFEFREIMDTGRSLNSRGRKFKNRAPTSCSPDPILWPLTISFELHAKPTEEIGLEKSTFRNFGSSVTLTLTLDQVEVTLVHTSGRGYPHTKLNGNRKNFLWTYGRTDGHTWVPIYYVIAWWWPKNWMIETSCLINCFYACEFSYGNGVREPM